MIQNYSKMLVRGLRPFDSTKREDYDQLLDMIHERQILVPVPAPYLTIQLGDSIAEMSYYPRGNCHCVHIHASSQPRQLKGDRIVNISAEDGLTLAGILREYTVGLGPDFSHAHATNFLVRCGGERYIVDFPFSSVRGYKVSREQPKEPIPERLKSERPLLERLKRGFKANLGALLWHDHS